MRRLEHAGEEKFWEAWIKDDAIFCYRFGKIGTSGQTRLKRHATRAEADADLEENIGRKIEEGFEETGDAKPVAKAEKAEKPEKHEAPKKAAPARISVARVQPELVTAAKSALDALKNALGGRSWKVRRLGRAARRALERMQGADPSKHGFGDEFDALMRAVIAGDDRLPLDVAVGLLSELDSAVYVRTVKSWKSASGAAKETVTVLATSAEAIHDADVALAVGAALADRALDAPSWRKRFQRVKPSLEAALQKNGSTLNKFLKSLDASDDAVLLGRIEEAAR
jgi:predicted DNA-binding WGR domain protein